MTKEKREEKEGRSKLRETGKSTFVGQQESIARLYVCIHNELRLPPPPSKRDEPKRGPGQNASRTNTKNRPFKERVGASVRV